MDEECDAAPLCPQDPTLDKGGFDVRCARASGVAVGVLAALVIVGIVHSLLFAPVSNRDLLATMLLEEGNCSAFVCPDGFRLKDNAKEITGLVRPGLCCEEAICKCSPEPDSTEFTCSFQMLESRCGTGWRCAVDSNKTWRYFTDRYSACVRTLPLEPTKAPLRSFYIYRSDAPNKTFLDGMEATNAIGQILRLHKEVVWQEWPHWGYISRIRRLKLTLRATRPLLERNMHFGPLETIDSGRCEAFSWHDYGFCTALLEKYGSVVGCKHEFDSPRWNWEDPTGGQLVNEVIWYSLPGPCSDRFFEDRDAACMQLDPGGRCEGIPTGTSDCSYSVEPAGEIGINELASIEDYEAFYRNGGREYDRDTDRGVKTSFWDHIGDAEAARRRTQVMLSLFKKKFGAEDLEDAFCDYRFDPQDACAQAIAVGHNNWGHLPEIMGC